MVVAGWYDNMDRLADDAYRLEWKGALGVYVTLNAVHPALLCRGYNRLVANPIATTCDTDVIWRNWLLLDIDAVRPIGVSASDDEMIAAEQTAYEVVSWLHDTIDVKPTVLACSGNGYHVLYRIELPNDDKSTAYVRGVINDAADRFDSGAAMINRNAHDAARICALYGTMTR